MYSDDALRPAAGRGDRRHRERRGIRRQNRIRRDGCRERGKERLLGGQLFDDGFDHDAAAAVGGDGLAEWQLDELNAFQRGVARCDRDLSLFDQLEERVANVRTRLGSRLRVGVSQDDLVSRLRGDLSDAAPHRASPDDADTNRIARAGHASFGNKIRPIAFLNVPRTSASAFPDTPARPPRNPPYAPLRVAALPRSRADDRDPRRASG